MNEQNQPAKHSLPLPLLNRVDEICDRFEQAWKAGQQPKIADFLAQATEQERSFLFRELLAAEVEFRRAKGETIVPEIYQQQFPEHAQVVEELLAEAATQPPTPGAEAETPWTGTEPATKPGPPSDLPPRVGGYHIEEEIDHGGMGRILRVRDEDFGRPLAMKVLLNRSRDLEERFEREARMTGLLQHPGIPPVHARGRLDDGRPYFVMKLIQGKSLQALLRQRPSPAADLPRFIAIFEQICQTVGYAHSRGVIHRDLKPANIMVGAFGEVQVMDWGLAKLVQSDSTDHESVGPAPETIHELRRTVTKGDGTQAGAIMGTPNYMPPEQARGEVACLDARADVFGLGAILCEILTGAPPYRGSDALAVACQAALGELAEALSRLDACGADGELVQLARECLAPQRENRPANGSAVAERITTYQAELDQRLRQAEIDRATAHARAEEEQKLREAEQARADEEKKRRLVEEAKAAEEKKRRLVERQKRRRTVALAAALLLLAIGISAAIIWYLDHRATQATNLALAERDVRKYLETADDAHTKLIEELKKPGGVQSLLNQKESWELRIQTARAAWKVAKDTAEKAEVDPELLKRLEELDGDLARDQRDFDLAWRLEKIRLDTATIVEGKFDFAIAEREYPKAFAEAGLALEPERLKDTAQLIQQSVIKEQLLAALEHWAFNPKDANQSNHLLSRRVLEAIAIVDSNPWSNKVRKLAVSKDLAAIEKLADELRRDQDLFGRVSPPMVVFLADEVPKVKQESWLRMGQSLHPADFWCNFYVAISYGKKTRPKLWGISMQPWRSGQSLQLHLTTSAVPSTTRKSCSQPSTPSRKPWPSMIKKQTPGQTSARSEERRVAKQNTSRSTTYQLK
jgi:serine/threonine protein kinase